MSYIGHAESCVQVPKDEYEKLKRFFEMHADKVGQVSDTVRLPSKLTAENGARALLSGEFFEKVIVQCPHCDGEGWEDLDSCEVCGECTGSGDFALKVPVSWTTIKDIYAMVVKVMAMPERELWGELPTVDDYVE